ncbi:MAG TPA: imidazolonepropionase, partial [Actinobacteria bacterium]|nr:imidazolonepropionase [Actinomycetota bacterium]
MDFVLRNVGELTTNDLGPPAAGRVVLDAAVSVKDGLVTWVGPDDAIPSHVRALHQIDAGGRAVIPGFVD